MGYYLDYRALTVNMEDQTILNQVLNDDPQALAAVYSSHRNEFVGWIKRFARCDDDDAMEYFQASVIIFYDNIRSGKITDLQSSIKTYLFGVGKNLVWQSNRRQARHQRVYAEYYLSELVQQDSESQDLTESELDLVSHCFEQLSEHCHTLLDLFYYKQKKMEEIAVELGYKNIETTKNQKYKCMERLRKMVEEQRTLNAVT